ncbi:MAG: Amuc_1100 family pilus-like protein [Kiritimatiellaeota bacterium]|nr:Amuc_1100 family pilus-like protein [Kiritimatiellota bacterium]
MMDFIKKNLWLFLGGGGAILLLLAAAVFLFWQISGFRRVNTTLAEAHDRLLQLHRRNPYPSESNVLLVQSNLALLESYQQQLADQLRRGQIEPQAMQPVDFNHYVHTTIRKMLAQAKQLNMTLPQKFAFGFEAYYQEGLFPANADVSRLTVQLQSVEALFELLCQIKISEIVALDRQVFEQREASDAGPVAVMSRPRGEASAPEIKALYPVAPPEAEGLYTREHITLTLQARDEVILTLLNALASSGTAVTSKPKFFAVVSKLSMTAAAGVESKKAPEAALGARTPGKTAVTPENPAPPVEDQRTHEERIAAGRETVRVLLGLDLYRLNPHPPGKAKP